MRDSSNLMVQARLWDEVQAKLKVVAQLVYLPILLWFKNSILFEGYKHLQNSIEVHRIMYDLKCFSHMGSQTSIIFSHDNSFYYKGWIIVLEFVPWGAKIQILVIWRHLYSGICRKSTMVRFWTNCSLTFLILPWNFLCNEPLRCSKNPII